MSQNAGIRTTCFCCINPFSSVNFQAGCLSELKVAATYHRCNQALVDAVKSGRVLLPRPPAAAHKGAQHSSGAFDSALFHGTGSRSTLRNAGLVLISLQASITSLCRVCREISEESKCVLSVTSHFQGSWSGISRMQRP